MPCFILIDKDDKEIYFNDFLGISAMSFISSEGIKSCDAVKLPKNELVKQTNTACHLSQSILIPLFIPSREGKPEKKEDKYERKG